MKVKNSDPRRGPVHEPREFNSLSPGDQERIRNQLRDLWEEGEDLDEIEVVEDVVEDVAGEDEEDVESDEESSDEDDSGDSDYVQDDVDPIECDAYEMDGDVYEGAARASANVRKSGFNPREGVGFDNDSSQKKSNARTEREKRALGRKKRREEKKKKTLVSLEEKKRVAVENRLKKQDALPIRRRSWKKKKPRLWQHSEISELRDIYLRNQADGSLTKNTRGFGLRAVVNGTHVPKSTLYDHLTKKRSAVRGAPMKLSLDEEVSLVNDVVYLAKNGLTVTKQVILRVVQLYIIERRKKWIEDGNMEAIEAEKRRGCFKDDLPSNRWFSSFIRRHDSIRMSYQRTTTAAKASVTLEDLDEFLLNWWELTKNLPPENLINGDETNVRYDPEALKVKSQY
jgi:hypothetical protein